MTTNKARDGIAKLCVKPLADRLAERAREEVVENFCRPRCGHGPEGKLCSDANLLYKVFLSQLLKTYSQSN